MLGEPFYGGFGLLTVHGVAKPAYRAFEMLANAGVHRLSAVTVADPDPQYMNESTVSAFATVGDARGIGDDLQIFLTNFGPETGASPTPWKPAARNVTLRMTRNASQAKWPAAALLRRIDDNATSPYDAWAKLGSPPYPTQVQLAALHEASQPKTSYVKLSVSGQVATLTLELPPYGVALVSF